MTGCAKETDNGWVVVYSKKITHPTADRYELETISVHPHYTKDLVNNTLVDFEIQTIAMGASEFDVMDADVAVIKNVKLFKI
jgi:hypothetical protein